MERVADYTIQGFLYQFNKTLVEIFNSSDDSQITVEGIIEDIDIVKHNCIKAVQCKYHEAQENFVLSLIYKPILQMMINHIKNCSNISFVLYSYFPNQTPGQFYQLTKDDVNKILSSKDVKLQKYINDVIEKINIDSFLAALSIEFGKSFDDLQKEVHQCLISNGIPVDDIDTIAYPNAINEIARIACNHSITDRFISKNILLKKLLGVKKTVITRWTLALKNRKKILDTKKKQLKPHFDLNARLRYFLINGASLSDFDSCIVLFISDYINKYHHKPSHIRTPLFCLDCDESKYSDIRFRVHQKGIIAEDGYVINFFDESRFFREPMTKKTKLDFEREFQIRIIHYNSHTDIINKKKCDDLFIIGEAIYDDIILQDMCSECIAVSNLKEAKYILGVSNEYE